MSEESKYNFMAMAEEEELQDIAAALDDATDRPGPMGDSDTPTVPPAEGPSDEEYVNKELPPLIKNGMLNKCTY